MLYFKYPCCLSLEPNKLSHDRISVSSYVFFECFMHGYLVLMNHSTHCVFKLASTMQILWEFGGYVFEKQACAPSIRPLTIVWMYWHTTWAMKLRNKYIFLNYYNS